MSNEKFSELEVPQLPPEPAVIRGSSYVSGRPTAKQQSYGAIVSIIIIVGIVVIGALYVWGEGLATENSAASVIRSLNAGATTTESLVE